MPIAAAVPAIVGIGSAVLGANASRSAANAQVRAADAATAEQQRQYDQTRADQMPYLESGYKGLSDLNALASGDFSKFYADPGYNFAVQQGQKGVGNSFAARGGAASGNALKALSQFNQGLAQQQYGDFYNRTAARAGVGQTVANGLGVLGANAANQIGQNMLAAGDARASGILGSTNSILNAGNSIFNNYAYGKKI